MHDIDVFCHPADDLAFERRVRQLAHGNPSDTIEQVETRLRVEYPRARLILRAPLTDVLPINDRVTWYARRNGLAQ